MIKTIRMKITETLNLKEVVPCNVGDVKLTSIMSHKINLYVYWGTKSLTDNRRLISYQLGRVMFNTPLHRMIAEASASQVWFSKVDPSPFRIQLSNSQHNMQCKGHLTYLNSQNACLEHMQKMQTLLTNFDFLLLIKVGFATLIVRSIYYA